MAKERGKNVLLKVDTGASPTVFQSLAGQRGCTLSINGSAIDTSDKTSDGWATALASLKTLEVACNGVAVWPDTDGLDKIREAATAASDDDALIDCRVVLNTAGAYYQARFSITNFEIDGPHDGVTTYSFNLTASEAPTYAASGG